MADERDIAALAVLADAQRRRVFEQVQSVGECSVTDLVESLGIGRTLVSFHLTKLVDAALVEVVPAQRRRAARGRPSQLYRITRREVAASVPDRRYDLLAGVLLDGLAEHRRGETAQASAARAAHRRGSELARSFGAGRSARSVAARLTRLHELLGSLGYLPRAEGGEVVVRNCPYDSLRPGGTDQVCPVNLALAEGMVDGLGLSERVTVSLRPCPDSCCVVFDTGRV